MNVSVALSTLDSENIQVNTRGMSVVVVVVPNKGHGPSRDADWLRQSTAAVPDPLADSHPHRLEPLFSFSLLFFLPIHHFFPFKTILSFPLIL